MVERTFGWIMHPRRLKETAQPTATHCDATAQTKEAVGTCKQQAVNLQIPQVYLQHSDPEHAKRTWRLVMDRMGELKSGNTRKRWDMAVKDRAFDPFRSLALIKTQAEHFLTALQEGTVSTNVFLRRIHNFALDMDWIPKAIIPKRQWPRIEFHAKRAITWPEHQAILAQEKNPEYCAYYELLWHLGGSESDIANRLFEAASVRQI